MRRSRFAALVLALLAGCAGADPDTPDAVTVFSLDPESTYRRQDERPAAPPGVEALHGWDVLGKVDVADPAVRREVVAAVREALAAPDKHWNCFDPRHAVRVVRGGRVEDHVICFGCGWCDVLHDTEAESHGTEGAKMIGPPARPLLDRLLADAGVALSPLPRPAGR